MSKDSVNHNGAQVKPPSHNGSDDVFNRSAPTNGHSANSNGHSNGYPHNGAPSGVHQTPPEPHPDEQELIVLMFAAPKIAGMACRLTPPLTGFHFTDRRTSFVFRAANALVPKRITPTPEAVQAELDEWASDPNSNDPTAPEAAREWLENLTIPAAPDAEAAKARALQLAASIRKRYEDSLPPFQEEEVPAPEFGFTTDNDLDDRLGEIEWEWPGYIPRGFVTAIVGDQDVGKSQVAQSLCDIRLRGNRWPDGQPHESHPDTKMLWIDTEGSIALFHQRMKFWGMKRGCFILPPDPLQELTVDDELHWMWIEAAIEKFMPPIVVIDALSGAHKSGKENGNDEMKPVMKKLAGLAQKYNIAVLVVHHLNKPIAGVAPYPITIHRLRGASAIPQYCRSILALGSPDVNQPEKRRMDVIKLNLAKKPAPVGYELSDHGPLWGDAPEPPKERRAIDDALDFLEIALKDGPRLSEDVQGEAKAQKIGSNALRDAMKAMKVKPRREGGKDGRWFWYPTTEAHKDGQE
jgi:RecA/RadA recombinase